MKKKMILLTAAVFFSLGTFLSFAVGETADLKKITVLCGTWVDTSLKDFEEKWGYDLLERFSQETGIAVKLEAYPFRQLFRMIEVRMAAKDSNVDLFWVDSPLTASYAVRGYTTPIGEKLLSKEE